MSATRIEAPPAAPAPRATRAPRAPTGIGWRGRLAGATAVYLGVSLLIWAGVWLTGANPAHTITCPCGDVAEQVWWFEWLPRALLAGHNPFWSNALFARLGGINGMSNTSWMLPALVLSPVTLAFGPIASFNVANLVAPVLSGLGAYALAGRFVMRWWVRVLCGLVFSYSPFVWGNVDLGHVNLTMLAYVPLVLVVGDRLLRDGLSGVRAGVALGALTVCEAFIGTEVVAVTAVTAAWCLVALLVVKRSVVLERWRALAVATATGGAICAMALAYPIWLFFAGPQHIEGPFWPPTHAVAWSKLVAPQLGFGSPAGNLALVGYDGPRGPGTAYLGAGLLVVGILGLALARSRRLQCVVLGAALGCVLLEVDPWLWLRHVPVVQDIVHVRFSIGTTVLLALAMALTIDGVLRPTRPLAVRLAARGGRLASGAVALLCAAAVVVPVAVTYRVPFTVQPTSVPTWFTTAGQRVPTGTAVLVLPFAWLVDDRAMAWQAESHDRFGLVGGFGFIRGADGRHDEILSPPAVPALLVTMSRGATLTAAQVVALHRALASFAPLRVVAIDGQVSSGTVADVTEVLGPPVSHRDGATTWVVPAPAGTP